MITHLHSVTLVVADQDAALDFYVNTLGWEKATDQSTGDGDRWVTVVPPGATTQIALAPSTWFEGVGQRSKDSGITLVAPDIDATYETLLARGVNFRVPVTVMPWGTKAAWFYDLDGYEFFLVAG
jgi:catechol 2,3-dioxygenase-like lactoylglutathione lyase family enzyme